MTHFIEDIIHNNFFFISSDNYYQVRSRFYGYALQDNKILIRSNPQYQYLDLLTPGMYVNILVNNYKIIIQQDYFCGFGIFIFSTGKFWAISNSFYYLVTKLAPEYKLDLNEDYIDLFLTQDLVPTSITETAICSINELSSGQYVEIDKTDGKLSIKEACIHKYSLPLLSPEGIWHLDNWYQKYKAIAYGIVNNKFQLIADLSGGMDSRAALASVLPAILHSSHAGLRSVTDKLHTHAEDYQIATQIANIYGCELNRKPSYASFPLSEQDSIAIIRYSKLLFHDEFFFPNNVAVEPVFLFGGGGGEAHRQYWDDTRADYVLHLTEKERIPGFEARQGAKRLLIRVFDYIEQRYTENIPDSQKLYHYTRIKNHFMRSYLGSFLCNYISIQPLLDPALFLLDMEAQTSNDRNLLFALIFARYLPELKDIKFEGNRSISTDLWDRVKGFDLKNFPIEEHEQDQIKFICSNPAIHVSSGCVNISPRKVFCSQFSKESVRNFVIARFGCDAYKYALDYYHNYLYFPERIINKFLSIYILYRIISNSLLEAKSLAKYENTGMMKFLLRDLHTARIDLKLSGKPENNMEVLECTARNAQFFYPKWFAGSDGKGLVCHICGDETKLRMRANGNGNLSIIFRGIDRRDMHNKRLPFAIDYLNVKIYYENGKNELIFSQNDFFCATHDNFFECADIKIENGVIINLYLNIKPSDYTRDQLDLILDNIYQQFDYNKLSWDKLG